MKVIIVGIGVFLAVSTLLWFLCVDSCHTQVFWAVQDVDSSQGAIVKTFEKMVSFFQRLATYLDAHPTTPIKNMNERILLAVLSILALMTEEVRQGRMSESIKARCAYIISSSLHIRKGFGEDVNGTEVRN